MDIASLHLRLGQVHEETLNKGTYVVFFSPTSIQILLNKR